MRLRKIRGMVLCATAALSVAGAAHASDWEIPGMGIVTLPQGTSVTEGMPQVASQGDFSARLQRHGIYGSESYLLRRQDGADFMYAWAACIPLDAAFVRIERIPARSVPPGDRNGEVHGAWPLLVIKKTIRDVPPDRGERMARAADLVRQVRGDAVRDVSPWTNADRDGAVMEGSWTRPWHRHGVQMDQYCHAWLVDQGTTVDLFLLVTDTQHAAWIADLAHAWERRRASRSRYIR